MNGCFDKKTLIVFNLRLSLTFPSSYNLPKVNNKKKSHIYMRSCFLFVYFFSIWVFFQEHSRFTGQQGKGKAVSLGPLDHFHQLHIHLYISRAITAESSPLHIVVGIEPGTFGLRPAALLKKRLLHGCFPLNFAKFLRTPFFTGHLWWLLLDIQKPNKVSSMRRFSIYS